MNRTLLLVTIVISTALSAVLDFCTSEELVGAILFTLPLALCGLQSSKWLLWGTATATVLLTIAAQFWCFNRTEGVSLNPWNAWINRGLLIGTLLTLARFIQLRIDTREKALFNAAEIERQRSTLATQNQQLEILVAAAARDSSVRKQAERHLMQMEGRYRGLLEAAPDPMVLVNQSGLIVLVNQQAERVFGYGREELVGQSPRKLISEDSVERLIAHTRRTADGDFAEQIHTGIELEGRDKGGSNSPIEVTLSRLETAEGSLLAVAVRDVSLRKNSETKLLHTLDELKRSNEELGQFAYIASHDLQEPLRMVASYTQLLSKRYKGKLDADADDFIGFAVDGANRMQRLIEDLLAYSRVGTTAMELRETSSEEAFEQAVMNLGRAIEESGALLTHDPLPPVMADRGQLVQLFQNLLGNAIKYQPPGVPRVHVSSATGGKANWLFSVQDNGLGIDPRYFEKIFGMFQRLHKRQDFAGTGIGLSICKKIVERHGGNISVDSQPGQGSTFRFALASASQPSASS